MPDIDDPFKPSDATILRPRPGAGRRGSPENVPPLRSAAPAASHAEPISDAARDLLGTGLNSLVQAASTLLLLAGQLRGTLSVPDIAGLRRQALDEVRRFEARARAAGSQNEGMLAPPYALRPGLDGPGL